ncbi:MAG TPA: DUF924 family protein [Usitatibacteraceae bacterium]|nr:DUF924 family protein [Usitatibacteraceae bacterium]
MSAGGDVACPAEALEVLAFWFGEPGSPARGKSREAWFRKDAAFDAEIRRRFLALHASAALGERDRWRDGAPSLLALVIVLDQFSRNLYRDDARAFSQDAQALDCARHMIDRGWDAALLPVERQFAYLPFEHAEDLALQDRSIELFCALEAFPETRGLAGWARKHRVIVERFGRFPHRNAALGRESTQEELAFLKEPGSRF